MRGVGEGQVEGVLCSMASIAGRTSMLPGLEASLWDTTTAAPAQALLGSGVLQMVTKLPTVHLCSCLRM